jgi:16S rRNA (guanine966-N2)-methyltransferase
MRIIGGEAKGRILHFPSGSRQRPTTDFLREALFNLLGPLPGKSFLDLFAGSGSVGLEAASRGADRVVLIEKDREIVRTAMKNAADLGFGDKCRIIAADVGTGLTQLFQDKYKFDILFADPPYDKQLVGKTIKLLIAKPVLQAGSVVVIQHSAREDFQAFLNEKAVLSDQRKYGDNILSFLNMECL